MEKRVVGVREITRKVRGNKNEVEGANGGEL